LGVADDLAQFLNLRALLRRPQFGIPDDVDEKNVREF